MSRAGRRTAFERNLLPGFASWVVDHIERWEPDYLIPAETKGARILDAALDYAREVMGKRVSVPIIYTSALPYIPAEKLRESRVMVIDDAVRTGSSLDRHRAEIEHHQVREIKSIACIGCREEVAERPEVDCYLYAAPSLYERYVWQLTELVVARGLPPEVDHFLFELRLPGRFKRSWSTLDPLLAPFGTVTVDGPVSRREAPQPLTLHFPNFPGTRSDRAVEGAGANKLRLFPDPDRLRSFAVPICFPALELKDVEPRTPMPPDRARAAVREAMDTVPAFGELLLERATGLEPKAVFRIVSACKEVEMIAGVARLIGAGHPGASLRGYAEGVARLYGPELGPQVFELVAAEIDCAVVAGAAAPAAERPNQPAEPELFLDPDVEQATHKLAKELKRLYDEKETNDAVEEWMKVGRAMPELVAEVRGRDPLLASRCIDFGLALTTLVPLIAEVKLRGGGLRIERRYRVSENNRGHQEYSNLDYEQRKKSEEALGVICKRLQDNCRHFKSGVPLDKVTPLVAILRPLVLAEQSLTLKAVPGSDGGLLLLLSDAVAPVPAEDAKSAYLAIGESRRHVELKPHFQEAYDAKDLTLDLDGFTEGLEDQVDKLIELIDPLPEEGLDRVLRGWAMCVDRRLGMTDVRHFLNAALDKMRDALWDVQGGTLHEGESSLAAEVRDRVSFATAGVVQLEEDWSEPARKTWENRRGRAPERLLSQLYAPRDAADLYAFATAFGELVNAVAECVQLLSVTSRAHWDKQRVDARLAAQRALECSTAARHALWSLEGQAPAAPVAPADGREALHAAAGELLDLVELLDAFAAALAGVYCGAKGRREDPTEFGISRQVSVLSLDLAESTPHGEVLKPLENQRWVEGGLDLGAQWTRAYKGAELSDRRGDDLTVEFSPASDAPVLAGAFAIRHVAALRSTGADDVSWTYHAAVECGQVDDSDGSNAIGPCINRASKLAEASKAEAEILLGEDQRKQCSEQLCAVPLSQQADAIEIAPSKTVRPQAVDAAQVVAAVTARVSALAGELSAGLAGVAEPPLLTEGDSEAAAAAESSRAS